MRRREFVGLIGGAVALWFRESNAQQKKRYTIGILVSGSPDPDQFLTVLREELTGLGYVEGRNCHYEVRSAQGDASQLPALASELIRLPVDVLVTWLTPSAIAARNATKDVPIVMASAGDPIALGIVESLSRPGGNITGNSAIAVEIVPKNIELLREMIPNLSRIAVFANAVDPFTKPFVQRIEAVTGSVGIGLETMMASPPDDPEPHFALMKEKKVEAAIIQPTLLRPGLADLAVRYRLPTTSIVSEFPAAGGLMSYSANGPALWKQSATYVDNILKGQRPSDLPVAQPTGFDFVINLRTARALGITVPATLIARADQVIE